MKFSFCYTNLFETTNNVLIFALLKKNVSNRKKCNSLHFHAPQKENILCSNPILLSVNAIDYKILNKHCCI